VSTGYSTHYVDVEIDSSLTRGMTVVDKLDVAANPRNQFIWRDLIDRPRNVKVIWDLDVQRWKDLLYHSLAVTG
jgi:inosine-uridine nucleoside N-ribohydrolase